MGRRFWWFQRVLRGRYGGKNRLSPISPTQNPRKNGCTHKGVTPVTGEISTILFYLCNDAVSGSWKGRTVGPV